MEKEFARIEFEMQEALEEIRREDISDIETMSWSHRILSLKQEAIMLRLDRIEDFFMQALEKHKESNIIIKEKENDN